MHTSYRQPSTLPPVRPARVVGIQFSIMSPDEIRKGSVVEITSRDTYVNNKPVSNGLFDIKMGVLERGLICKTDGLRHMDTPGYHGHIELARPVFYIQFLSTVLKIMKCVCFKCSKVLISKHKHRDLLHLPPDQRWKHITEDLCKDIRRCGDESEDGCGTLQPKRIRKEGLANLFAEWNADGSNGFGASMSSSSSTSSSGASGVSNGVSGGGGGGGEPLVVRVTAEMVLKIFKRISDDDVHFLGFSPVFSRPEWMICQVLLVPPPAVRPSVKHDSQQRSEDDLTHILVSIIKTNKTLKEKMANQCKESVIEDWTALLQYYIACQVDNQIPGVASVAQRSGRPFKSIKDRLKSKGGRMRGNLMAKRVDFSARSVITADPNLRIDELGVPMRVAKNISVPVRVNERNRAFLTQLVRNGPDVYPGAKTLEKSTGSINLRYFGDRAALLLEDGDIVHRHLMDNDPVLFNRQPTLHRMNMMCHTTKVMRLADTFRMNLAVTKSYNADFDGDEMNMHVPQDQEAMAELRHIAAVPYQIVSPANNAPIIGIYQDSMLGSYLFTREHLHFTRREAMKMLMLFDRVRPEAWRNGPDGNSPDGDSPDGDSPDGNSPNHTVSNFDILSQILPPLSAKYRTKAFKEGSDDMATSNAVVEIRNGRYLRGQIDKSVLGARTKGLIHRICNDFGNMASAKFIDDWQNIVTEYMQHAGYSVGVCDLLSTAAAHHESVQVLTKKQSDVQELLDQVRIGVFENNTGRSNEEEVETRINSNLNQATSEAGKIGLKNLRPNNRFVQQVQSGSKGSDLNIAQMISCVGQQNVDGKRIPYGFDHRTLPHFAKYDDSPEARGFVVSSYVGGLTPQEFFFHAMGGRVGIIDTAVKTSATGYIQRRIIKGLEDLMVGYDMTVRNSKHKIVQFAYGDDHIDTTKVEEQPLPLVSMSIQDIYAHYLPPDDKRTTRQLQSLFTKDAWKNYKRQLGDYKLRAQTYVQMMLLHRDVLVDKVFKRRGDTTVHCPVAFQHLLNNLQGQCHIHASSTVDITPLEALDMIEHGYARLCKLHYTPPTQLFQTLFFFYLSPKELVLVKRFNRAVLTAALHMVSVQYKRALVAPGEMVGMIAAQSLGEVSTQMTLNTFHFAGVASKSNVTRGVPRIEEILKLTEKIKNPSLSVYLKPEDEGSKDKAHTIMYMLEHTKLKEVVQSYQLCFDPDDDATLLDEDRDTLLQHRAFEQMLRDCAEIDGAHSQQGGAGAGAGAGAEKAASVSAKEVAANTKSKWIMRMVMDPTVMLDKNITMDDIYIALKLSQGDNIDCVFSDYNADQLVFRVRVKEALTKPKPPTKAAAAAAAAAATAGAEWPTERTISALDQSDHICVLKRFQEQMLQNVVLRGIKGLNKVVLRKVVDNVVKRNGTYEKQDIWVLDTVGSNLLEVLGVDYVDATRTISNDIMEVYDVLGIEAARQAIYNELVEVVEFDGTYIDYHNYSVLVDRMCHSHKLISICRGGINSDDIGPIAKASFEETPEMFLKAARHAELDWMTGVSANVMVAQEGFFGTAAFQVLVDLGKTADTAPQQEDRDQGKPRDWDNDEDKDTVEEQRKDTMKNKEEDGSSTAVAEQWWSEDMAMDLDLHHLKAVDHGTMDDDYEMPF